MPIGGRSSRGAQDVLTQILARDFLQQQQAAQQAAEEQDRIERAARAAESTRQFEVERGDRSAAAAREERRLDALLKRQEAQDEVAAGDRREKSNARGVQRMLGEFIGREGRPKTGDTRAQLEGMALQEGIELPASLTKPTPEEEDTRDLAKARQLAEIQYSTAAKYREPREPRATTEKAPPRMPAAMASRMADTETSLGTLTQLEAAFDPAFVGPAAGRYNQMERGAPSMIRGLMPEAPKGFEKFNALSAALKNDLIRAITGAAVGVQEQARIMGQIPDVTDSPENWRAKLAITKDNLQRLQAAVARAGGQAETPLTDVEVNVPGIGVGGGSAYDRYRQRRGGG